MLGVSSSESLLTTMVDRKLLIPVQNFMNSYVKVSRLVRLD